GGLSQGFRCKGVGGAILTVFLLPYRRCLKPRNSDPLRQVVELNLHSVKRCVFRSSQVTTQEHNSRREDLARIPGSTYLRPRTLAVQQCGGQTLRHTLYDGIHEVPSE